MTNADHASPEDTKMDIHKPKPWHNLREFLKEYVIIVLGVATALAGEQAVEHWRDHRQYLESREAMRAELAGDIANQLYRPAISACATQRIAEIGALLDKAEKHQPFDAPSWVGEASSTRIRVSAEGDAARSGLFSPVEQRQFSTAYSLLHSVDQEMDRERQAWARLQALEGRTSVTPEMIADLRQALAEARYQDRRIQQLMALLRGNVRPLSLPAAEPYLTVGRPQAWALCLPMNTPRDEAIRRTAFPGAQ